MISSEVQRTLVKSPPELWAEISDPDSLARHLGDFGEIRITRVDPEQKVEWEAGSTSGTVVIKPSGWGTKVKLTVNRELPEPATPQGAEPEPAQHTAVIATTGAEAATEAPQAGTEPEIELAAAREPEAEIESEPLVDPQAEIESEPQAEPESEATADAGLEAFEDHEPFELAPALEPLPPLEPRRGFFARLFGRFRDESETVQETALEQSTAGDDCLEASEDSAFSGECHESPDAADAWAAWVGKPETAAAIAETAAAIAEAEPARAEPEPVAVVEATPEPVIEPTSERAPVAEPAPTDISAEIRAAEEVAAEEVTAVLTGVLDRLGAAHHRPFSRA